MKESRDPVQQEFIIRYVQQYIVSKVIESDCEETSKFNLVKIINRLSGFKVKTKLFETCLY